MLDWQQWLRRPQNVWLRRALFQVHLWTGIGVGLYVFAVCVSGSAIVYRDEIYKAAGKSPTVEVGSNRLTGDQLREAAHRDYPGYVITFLFEGRRPTQPAEIWLDRKGSVKQRLFDPYTGRDLGPSVPWPIQLTAWMSSLHTDLLAGPNGRIVNGVGSILLTLLCLTGAVLWWPGVDKWKRSLIFNPKSNWKRLNWDLHSSVGFWSFALVFMWAFTGIYLVFPTPFQKLVNRYAPLEYYKLPDDAAVVAPKAAPGVETNQVKFVLVADPAPSGASSSRAGVVSAMPGPGAGGPPGNGGNGAPRRRRFVPHYSKGDTFLRWFYYLHFGNFAGTKTKGAWVVLGLLPPFLVITGAIMWWNRVVSREARRMKKGLAVGAAA
ncbi:MAG TPA: PepSY-associated TM helix domain-containing protein [Bryobacteraceae bacterium]